MYEDSDSEDFSEEEFSEEQIYDERDEISEDSESEERERELRHDYESPDGQKYHIRDHNKSLDNYVKSEAKDGFMSKFIAETYAAKNKYTGEEIEKIEEEIDEAHEKFREEEEKIKELEKSGKSPKAEDLYHRLVTKKVKFCRRMQLKSIGLKNDWQDFGKAMDDIDDMYKNLT